MYYGPPCYGYALIYNLVYLAIPKKRPLCMKKQNVFVLFITTAKSEIQICSNKHETCLVQTALESSNCRDVCMNGVASF